MKKKMLIIVAIATSVMGIFSCKHEIEGLREDYTFDDWTFPAEQTWFPGGGSGIEVGGGGGAGGSASGEVIIADIKVNGVPPCMKFPIVNVLKKLVNVDPALYDAIKVYSNNGGVNNLTITSATSAEMIAETGQASFGVTRELANGQGWKIQLNFNYMKNSTEQFIGAALIHELYHIKSKKDGHTDYDNHVYYYSSNYLDSMISDLRTLYGISDLDAKALAIASVPPAAGDAFVRYNMSTIYAITIADKYLKTTKGSTKCAE
jgi:hypothetical protein